MKPTNRNGRQTSCLGLAVVLSSLWLTGCAPTTAVESPNTDEHEAHDHEHEHGIPDHKPKVFSEAVRQLVPRWKSVTTELQAGHADHAERELAELLDIIRWLPELAADTDLKKADWDHVQQLTTKLETLVVAQHASSGVSNSGDIDTLVTELQTLGEKTVAPAPEAPLTAAEAPLDSPSAPIP